VAGKLASIGVGLLCVGAGAALIAFGSRLTASLNVMYARLPGRVVYPPWAHRVLGAFFLVFGLVVAGVGGVLAH
jgi:hypothetical protein